MLLAGVSEARLKSKLFALRFPPNLILSGSNRPSWVFDRRCNRSCCDMDSGSTCAFRLPYLPQYPARSFRGSLGGSGPIILRWLVPVPLLHLASTSETQKAIRPGRSAYASLPGLPSSSFSGPLLRSPLSGLRPLDSLLAQRVARFRAVFHLCATQRVPSFRRMKPGFSPAARLPSLLALRFCFKSETHMGFPAVHIPLLRPLRRASFAPFCLPSFHPKVALQLACVAMTLVLFNFSKSSKRSSRLHHLETLIRPQPQSDKHYTNQITANTFVCRR
mgnify:CR=1 FL=1